MLEKTSGVSNDQWLFPFDICQYSELFLCCWQCLDTTRVTKWQLTLLAQKQFFIELVIIDFREMSFNLSSDWIEINIQHTWYVHNYVSKVYDFDISLENNWFLLIWINHFWQPLRWCNDNNYKLNVPKSSQNFTPSD